MTSEQYILQQLENFIKSNDLTGIDIVLQKPKERKFGDHATNLALQLARHLKKKPIDIALMS